MKTHALLVAAAASLMAGAGLLTAGGDDAVQKDRKQMAGTWQVISYEKDGNKAPPDQLAKTTFSADGKFVVEHEGKTVAAGTTVIDPSKTPKHSDAVFKVGDVTSKTKGIYEVDGDNMKICYALPGKDRPTEFSAKAGSGQVLIVYKRDKR